MDGDTDPGTSQKMIRRVVLLGSSGFIGGNLLTFFKKNSPEVEVVTPPAPGLDLTILEHAEALRPHLDLNAAVIVCAAIKKQLGDNLDIFTKNLLIAANLCRVLAKNPARRVLFFSSAAVYGEDVHNLNISEVTPVNPTSFYGLAKFTSEVLLAKSLNTTSLLMLRSPLVYGPGDQGGYGPTGFAQAAINRTPITLWGDGSEKREFVYVGDIARIVHRLTFHTCAGPLNLASGRSYTFQEAALMANSLTGSNEPTKSRQRTKNKADHGFDNSKLKTLLPGFQFTELAEGLRLTLESITSCHETLS